MVNLTDLDQEDALNLAEVFLITARGKLVPNELMGKLSQNALQYYIDSMEKALKAMEV